MLLQTTVYSSNMSDPTSNSSTESALNSEFFREFGKFATDLNALALEHKLATAYGRDHEIDNVLRTLAAPGNLYPYLVGGPRGGKTAIAHHAVNRIVRGECPAALLGRRVFELTPSRLINALGGTGNWHNAINAFFVRLVESGAVLFLRDFHSALGMGTGNGDGPDLSSVLTDLVQGMHPYMLFEGSTRGSEQLFTECPTLKSLMASIQIHGIARQNVGPILKCAIEDLEIMHEVAITQEAQDEVLELATRFQVNELLPGSALDMLKDVLATSIEAGSPVTRAIVLKRFKQRSGLPDFLVSDDAAYDEPATRDALAQRVYGQDAAVEAVLRMIALVRARLSNPLRPMGVFLFLGPTGVGKTELVKALARFLYGESERIVRFNMADYAYPYAVFLLFGNPNGDTETQRQGLLSTRLAPQPFSVLLLDEFEKADMTIYQRFLQLFDEGVLINGQGEEINLRNTIIVMTSNLGAQLVNKQIGFRLQDALEEAEQAVMRESESYFRPEFINRLDAVCFFKPLSRQVIRQIAKREINDVIAREGIRRLNLSISVDDAVIDLMVERGFDLRFGARYLKRQIERSLTYPLARQIARKRIEAGGAVRLIVREGEIAVTLVETRETEDTPAQSTDNPQRLLSAKDLRAQLDALKPRIERLMSQHDIPALKQRVAQMMDRVGEPDFWRDSRAAAQQIEAMNGLAQRVDHAENIDRLYEQCALALGQSSPERNRSKGINSALMDANRALAALNKELPLTELLLCLRSEADQGSAFVTIRTIGGGLAHEWVTDLARMYSAWARTRDFAVTVVNESAAEGGLQQVTLGISGYAAFALLKGETGAHRLVRPVPGKASDRVTIWAQIDVLPDLPLTAASQREVLRTVRIENKPVRESGVLEERITRSVTITQNGNISRTLHWRNRLRDDEFEEQLTRYLRALDQTIPTGVLSTDPDVLVAHQVRSYTVFKQQSVRDARTGLSSSQVRKVLTGALDQFLLAYLELTADT
jgi:ATP-dependent Clp protease ATP-binding subunit ClpA/protein subunit release factor B